MTESMLMEDAEIAVTVLQELRDMHIGALTIDDFGTGFSSLSYLLRFPVTMIKIDGSFVRDITTNPSSATLATAIIALAHSVGLKIIAEGVETEEQRVFLENAGCTYFQGYLVSRPLPLDKIEPLLWAYSRSNSV
jgi:EAL domain-containing protein (putative c-di-GMP-specific phosphodiesterase class I)